MKNRGTTALIALFFAGLVGLWVADAWKVPTSAERDRWKDRILVGMIDVKPDDLRKVEITGGAEPLVFERRAGNRWQMTAPIDVAADPSLVEGLAFKLKELTRKPQADTLAGDPAEYGLAPASRRVALWGAATDAPLAAIDLGKVSLDRRYVRAGTAGAGIEVVPALGLEVVDLPPVRWRDREVFRVPTFEVDAVEIRTAGEPAAPGSPGAARDLRLVRDLDAWRIVAPIRALAVENKVEGLVASLGSLRIANDAQFVATDVAEANLDRYGLKTPALTITVSAGRGGSRRPDQVLQVGKPVEGQPDRLYARVGDQDDVIAVGAQALAGLERPNPDAFRSEKVVDFAPNRVTKVRVEAAGVAYSIVRSGRDWFVDAPVGRADPKAVQEFLQALDGLRTGIYLPSSPEAQRVSGLERPAETIQVWQAAAPGAARSANDPGEPRVTLRLGNRDAGKKVFYAQVEGDTTVLAVPDAGANALFLKSWAFRDRLILTAATDQIEQIRFDGLGKRVTIQAPPIKVNLLKNAPTGWWLSDPVFASADDAAVGRLLKLLGELRVDGFAADGPVPLKPFGLDNPKLKVTWSTPTPLPSPIPLPKPGEPAAHAIRFSEQTLLVGGEVPDRRSARYAMLGGLQVVFILGGENLAALDGEWHDHRVLKFDPDRVEAVRIAWPGADRVVDLVRAGQGWSIAGSADVPGFDPKAAAAAVRAAATLTTPRFLQYAGEVPPAVGLAPPHMTLRFAGPKLSPPADLALSVAFEGGQGYAATPTIRPGAVFLVDSAPFAPWLALNPAPQPRLPDDVFLRDPPIGAPPAPPAPADRPGQGAEQPR